MSSQLGRQLEPLGGLVHELSVDLPHTRLAARPPLGALLLAAQALDRGTQRLEVTDHHALRGVQLGADGLLRPGLQRLELGPDPLDLSAALGQSGLQLLHVL